MSDDYGQGALTYMYSPKRRDWIVQRLEGTAWVYVRDATAEDRETLPLYGWSEYDHE